MDKVDKLDQQERSTPALALTRAQHWRATRRLTLQLLLIWLVTGFGAAFFARELTNLNLFGWPLSFYLAAQGSSLVYLAILAYYAWRMRRLDKASRVARIAGSAGSTRPETRP